MKKGLEPFQWRGSFFSKILGCVHSLWNKPRDPTFQNASGNYQNILRDAFCCRACARLFPPTVEMPLNARLGWKTRGWVIILGFGYSNQNSQEAPAGAALSRGPEAEVLGLACSSQALLLQSTCSEHEVRGEPLDMGGTWSRSRLGADEAWPALLQGADVLKVPVCESWAGFCCSHQEGTPLLPHHLRFSLSGGKDTSNRGPQGSEVWPETRRKTRRSVPVYRDKGPPLSQHGPEDEEGAEICHPGSLSVLSGLWNSPSPPRAWGDG